MPRAKRQLIQGSVDAVGPPLQRQSSSTTVRRVGKAVIRARFGSPEQAAQFVYAWNVGPITPPEEKVKGLAYVRASHIEKYDQAFFSNPADGSLKF
ncbi:hypothetical protein EST38_g8098 [Candolleomyces aberdarensis]|uniref:Uncharacterized protein n=1 Tax=Candolleomyces aberdarensis TaxID=2316362 RepID=A0A4Q2DE10_9AGAR|nr:hypothetical protein EST38_g8098 [Candolleomyces aberdarensis]